MGRQEQTNIQQINLREILVQQSASETQRMVIYTNNNRSNDYGPNFTEIFNGSSIQYQMTAVQKTML
jgi:hypothetical protein